MRAFPMFDDERQIFNGLTAAFRSVDSRTSNACRKIEAAQEHYFKINPSHEEAYKLKARDLLRNSLMKFTYCSMVTEQIHSLKNIIELNLNEGKQFDASEELFLTSVLFDNALFLWRSFLDFYLKYLVYFVCIKEIESMHVSAFKKQFQNIRTEKAEKVASYIFKNVISEKSDQKSNLWGDTLRSFRDKTSHNTLITPTMSENEGLCGIKRLTPKINEMTVADFVQRTFENPAFEMLVALQPTLYEVDWRSGPYFKGIYESY